jgi:hypothetical protein
MNPHASHTPGLRSWTVRVPRPAGVLVTPSPRSTASPALTSTGPTPKGLNEWERKALELSEGRSKLGDVISFAKTRTKAPFQTDYRPRPLRRVARSVLTAYQPDNPP